MIEWSSEDGCFVLTSSVNDNFLGFSTSSDWELDTDVDSDVDPDRDRDRGGGGLGGRNPGVVF